MAPTEPTLLADFLAQHDAHCPKCNYVLRGLLTDTCPECSTPLRLTVDHGCLLGAGSGPRVEALAWGATGLCGVLAALRVAVMLWFLREVRGQTTGTVWLNLVLHVGVLAGVAFELLAIKRARTNNERTALLVRYTLTLAIATLTVESLLLAIQFVGIRF